MNGTIDRVAFRILGFEIYWYAILIAVGILLGSVVASKELKRRGLSEDHVYDYLLWALPLGVVGARIYYVIFEWDFYRGDFGKMIDIRGGGLAIHGGLLAAVVVALVYCKVKKISFFQLADSLFPGVALGQAIGRWGNFINQEAHGTETTLPWAILVDGKRVHPTFLYESIGDFLIFLFLLAFARKHQTKDGQIMMLYMILYGALRFFVEGFRTDSLMLFGLRVAQLVSLAMIAVGIFGLYFLKRNPENKIK